MFKWPCWTACRRSASGRLGPFLQLLMFAQTYKTSPMDEEGKLMSRGASEYGAKRLGRMDTKSPGVSLRQQSGGARMLCGELVRWCVDSDRGHLLCFSPRVSRADVPLTHARERQVRAASALALKTGLHPSVRHCGCSSGELCFTLFCLKRRTLKRLTDRVQWWLPLMFQRSSMKDSILHGILRQGCACREGEVYPQCISASCSARTGRWPFQGDRWGNATDVWITHSFPRCALQELYPVQSARITHPSQVSVGIGAYRIDSRDWSSN